MNTYIWSAVGHWRIINKPIPIEISLLIKAIIRQEDYYTLISKQIVQELGLSRDSVRGYCKRNGLDGYGTEKSSLVNIRKQE